MRFLAQSLMLAMLGSACLSAQAQTKFSYQYPNGLVISRSGMQASTVNVGYLDLFTYSQAGFSAQDPPQSCVNDVYYYDITTAFGRDLPQMVQTYYINFGRGIKRFVFTRNPDGLCWLTLVEF